MKQLTKEWLNAVNDDLAVIKKILSDPALTNIVAFHAQQAIEKSFKAIMEEKDIAFIKTHNLQTLYIKIENILNFEVSEQILSELDRLYIDARYPTDLGLMPHGKPGTEEVIVYYNEALKIKEQTERFLENADSPE